MTTPLLSTLREPPVVGRYYMVPVIRNYPYFGKVGTWPVLGPLHSDKEHFNFPWPHYHIDIRFLTAREAAFIDRMGSIYGRSLIGEVQAKPLYSHGEPPHKGRPALARRKCTREAALYVYGAQAPVKALRADYPDPAPAIARPDGRLLCPHRKVDLSSFAPDANGVVVCPLHGLRVQCAKVAA